MDEWHPSGERVERGGKSQDCRQPNKGDQEGVASKVKNILKAVWNCRRSAWSRGSEWPAVLDEVQWSRPVVSDSATPWAVVYQASPSMEFSRQEYWSRLPSPSPGDLPDPGIKHRSPALQADALHLSHQGSPGLNERWTEMRVGTCLQGLITLDRRGLKVNGRDFTSWRRSLGHGPS